MILTCKACGSPHDMNDQYLSLYGGQQTVCQRCGAAMLIPRLEPTAPVGAGLTGSVGSAAWQEGKRLVIAQDAWLADRCVKCNLPAEGYRWEKSVTWRPPLLGLLVLIAWPLYLIVYLIVKKTVKLAIPVCPEHGAAMARGKRRAMWTVIVGLLMLFGGIGIFMVPQTQHSDTLPAIAGICIGLGFIVIIVAAVMSQTVRPLSVIKIADRCVWLKGAGPAYLESLAGESPHTGGFEVLPVPGPGQ